MRKEPCKQITAMDGHELRGLSDVVSKYDVFIIDLWGVIYNGKKIFPTAYETLNNLKKLNKTVYLVSNSPKSNQQTIQSLTGLGLSPNMYHKLMTAGQKVIDLLKLQVIEPEKVRPLKTYFIDHDQLCTWKDEAGLIEVNDINQADIIMGIHIDERMLDPTPFVPLFQQAIERNIAFVCANPDKYVIRYQEKMARVGLLSDLYESLGGKTVVVGKPHPIMFEEIMISNKDKSILLIGDSLVTDIAAAHHIKVDSLLITLGYHREEFHSIDEIQKGAVYEIYGVAPKYVCEQLFW